MMMVVAGIDSDEGGVSGATFSLPQHQLPRAPRSHERAFVDHNGCSWLVYERSLDPGDGMPRLYLVFESLMAARRVRVFPSAWRDLDARALEHLSWGR